MKVMHIIDSAGVYGAEKMILALSGALRRQGIEVEIASLRLPDESGRPMDNAARAVGLTVHSVEARRGLDLKAAASITKLARNRQVTVLHTHSYKANTLMAILRRIRPKHETVPTVATLHGWSHGQRFRRIWWYETLERALVGGADAVVAVSQGMVDQYGLAPRYGARLQVIPNGVETSDNEASVRPAGTDWAAAVSHEFPILGIGRLEPIKRYDLLLQAVRQCRDVGLDASLVLMGQGPALDELRRLASELAIGDFCWFPGYVDEPRRYMRAFKLLAITSDSEGVPMNLLEALHEGLAVVTRGVGGIPEVMRHCGLEDSLVATASASEIASAIQRLAGAQALRLELIRKGMDAAVQRYSAAAMARAYTIRYDSLPQAATHGC